MTTKLRKKFITENQLYIEQGIAEWYFKERNKKTYLLNKVNKQIL